MYDFSNLVQEIESKRSGDKRFFSIDSIKKSFSSIFNYINDLNVVLQAFDCHKGNAIINLDNNSFDKDQNKINCEIIIKCNELNNTVRMYLILSAPNLITASYQFNAINVVGKAILTSDLSEFFTDIKAISVSVMTK